MMSLASDEDCPVALDMLGALYRAEDERVEEMLDGIPEATRARLAVYLYGRSHTHTLGLRIASTCEGSSLRRACGLIGNAVYAASRRIGEAPVEDLRRGHGSRRISLGGSRSGLA